MTRPKPIRPSIIMMLLTCVFFCNSLMAQQSISLEVLSTYHTGVFDDGATEIIAHDSKSQSVYVTNGATGSIDILDISDPSNITLSNSIDLSPYGKGANSVAFSNGILAAAVENNNKQQPGQVVFFNRFGAYLNAVPAGALPDMVTFSPNGRYVLVANEGEPNDDFTIDPEGSVTIVDLKCGVHNPSVKQVGFTAFNNAQLDPSVRVNANPGNSTVAQDLEPEYIAVSANSRTAWVGLQENNAIAIIDIKAGKAKKIVGLGFKDHSQVGKGLDASDKTAGIDISTWPIKGMYMPDAITSYKRRGRQFYLLANEGDSRDYAGYSEEVRVEDLTLDPSVFPNAAFLQSDQAIGRMKTTLATGDSDGDGLFEEIYTYGARSFSIRRASGRLVYDSGDEFEQITAIELPSDFNSTNDENGSFKNRSDDKGPEPEAIEVARIKGRHYAFIGLERVGGIMVYDITRPRHPSFVQYINNRDFSVPATTAAAGDLGPEDVVFVSKNKSPIDDAILISANEVSGTISIFKVDTEESAPIPAPSSRTTEDQPVVDKLAKEVDSRFAFYPNPVESGVVHLSKASNVNIYTIDGISVLSADNVSEVDVSHLRKGLYLIKSGHGITQRLLIK